jgi:hypothetical protein
MMMKLVRSLSFAAMVCLSAGSVFAQGETAERPFTVHWAAITCPQELRWRTNVDWAQTIEFEGAPIKKDTVVLYEHDFLLDVRTTGLSITTDSDWYTQYDNRLDALVQSKIPDPDFAGNVCIDVEFIALTWGNRTGGPGLSPQTPAAPRRYFDEWYDYIRTRRPELIANMNSQQQENALRTSYEQATKDLFLRTIQRLQTLRPNAKFGYYAQPLRRNGEYSNPAQLPAVRAYNDSLRWLFDAQDVFFLELYQRFFVAETPQQVNWNVRWPKADLERLMRGNIEEARRVAGEKPVYVLTMVRFSELTPGHELEPLPDDLYDLAIRSPKEYGADGLVIWDFLRSDNDRQRLQTYMTQHVNWRLREVTRDPNQPAGDDPLADAGTVPDPESPSSSPSQPDVPSAPAATPPSQPRAEAPAPSESRDNPQPGSPLPVAAQPSNAAANNSVPDPVGLSTGAPIAPIMAASSSPQRRSPVVPQRGVRVNRAVSTQRVVATAARNNSSNASANQTQQRVSSAARPAGVSSRATTGPRRGNSTFVSRLAQPPVQQHATANE